MQKSIKKILDYCFSEAKWDYDRLTVQMRSLITKEELEELKKEYAEDIEEPEVINEGYTMLMEMYNGLFEFGAFSEKDGNRVVDIFQDEHDAHLDMLNHYKDCVEAVKEGNMEDFEYNCIIAAVKEFEDEYIAFDDNGTEICKISKDEVNE